MATQHAAHLLTCWLGLLLVASSPVTQAETACDRASAGTVSCSLDGDAMMQMNKLDLRAAIAASENQEQQDEETEDEQEDGQQHQEEEEEEKQEEDEEEEEEEEEEDEQEEKAEEEDGTEERDDAALQQEAEGAGRSRRRRRGTRRRTGTRRRRRRGSRRRSKVSEVAGSQQKPPTPIVDPRPPPTPIVDPRPELPTPIVDPRPTPIVDPRPPPTPIVDPRPPPTPIVDPRPPPTPIVDPRPPPTPTVDPRPQPTPIVDPRPPPTPIVDPRPLPTSIVDPRPPPTPIVDPRPQPTPIVDPRPPTPIVNPMPPPTPIVDPRPLPTPIVDPRPQPTPIVDPRPQPTSIVDPSPHPTPIVDPRPPPTLIVDPLPTATPIVDPRPEPPAAKVEKRGLTCVANLGCNEKHTNAMNGHVSWMYNYRQRVELPGSSSGGVLDWANTNGIEFVPMVRSRAINDLSGAPCYIGSYGGEFAPEKAKTKSPQCSMQNITDTFAKLNSEMTVRPKYLMGQNEPYDTHVKHKTMDPREAAEYYRKIFIPVADQFGYTLVSPTTAPQSASSMGTDDGLSKDKMGWLVKFLAACYNMRDADPPCDYTKVKVISLHRYTCKESFWRNWFEGDDAFFKTKLLEKLNAETPEREAPGWKPYVDQMKFWVTETNCNWDGKKNNAPEPEVQCNRIKGKDPHEPKKYGIGSLRTMEELPDIERYSWWNLYNNQDRQMTQTAKLANKDGSLTPIGKAFQAMSWQDPSSVKCD